MSGERALLLRLRDGPVPGDVLARESGQTRAAVWKRVESLRAAGVEILAQPGHGYALAQPADLLDAARLQALLAPDVLTHLHALEVLWSIDSTNAELLRRVAPAEGADVLLAERQTGGRGRRGRPWASPLAAKLYLSVSRQFAGGLTRLAGLSLVAGVAAVEALHGLGLTMVRLKWPNDLVVASVAGELRKLGGVLVEGGGEHAGPVRAVIGLGLNVRMPAAAGVGIDQPWADLASLADGPLPARNALVAALLGRLLPALAAFDVRGMAPVLERYADFDVLQGREVVVHSGEKGDAGIALGLAEDGALRVRMAEGERRFHSGEVRVRARQEVQA
ncbi:bifunctional biotin--[acetyl-CoA-carboxylase] ligase/biotin operon repressor BirA [soil metagenome]